MVITFNFKDSSKTITFAEIEAAEKGSDFTDFGAPKTDGNPSGEIAVCFYCSAIDDHRSAGRKGTL